MTTYEADEKLGVITTILNRLETGDLVPLCTRILMCVDTGNGVELLRNITQWDALERDDRIALIAIIRVASFDLEMTYGWNICLPNDKRTIVQHWDEATDVLDGTATLYADVMSKKINVGGQTKYIHKIINCTNDHVYTWVLPHMNWCRPVDAETQDDQN